MNKFRVLTTDLDNKIDFYLKNKIEDTIIKKNRKKIYKELNIDS